MRSLILRTGNIYSQSISGTDWYDPDIIRKVKLETITMDPISQVMRLDVNVLDSSQPNPGVITLFASYTCFEVVSPFDQLDYKTAPDTRYPTYLSINVTNVMNFPDIFNSRNCDHEAVGTGMRKTWCKFCDITGENIMGNITWKDK